ncbi:MAG TPA: hypothetical protein PLO25_01095 [Candidatus Saccharibacteria bacterium]|nr:hypothetical protein [Candidatus Saccharibacteria bacterium]
MDEKIQKTINKTVEALERIGRFLEKYGNQLDKKQISTIEKSIQELQDKSKKL